MGDRGGEAGPSGRHDPDASKAKAPRPSHNTDAWQPAYAKDAEGKARTWLANKGKQEGVHGRHEVECTICSNNGLQGPPYEWVFGCNKKAIDQHERSNFHRGSAERVENDTLWEQGGHECSWCMSTPMHPAPLCRLHACRCAAAPLADMPRAAGKPRAACIDQLADMS
jgi:hypothetical protein